MKKLLIVLLVIILLTSHAMAVESSWRVFDNAGLFTAEEIAKIELEIKAFQQEANMDYVVLTTDDFLGIDIQMHIADNFYDYGAFGYGSKNSGILEYIDMNQRVHYYSTTGDAINCISNDVLSIMLDSSQQSLSANNFAGGILISIQIAKEAILKRNEAAVK